MLYNNLSEYFRIKYGRRLGKICIDGGFTCPNRDGKCGVGGCIYCGERGAGEHIDPCLSIREQVERGLCDADDDELFVAYFQNFTNTYADVETLRARYDTALFDSRIKVLAIGTRPDCINDEIAELIESYKSKCDVWVELGLQTANDKTAEAINRGYPRSVFEDAMKILEKHNIPVVVHLIVGLPGETKADVEETVKYLNGFRIWGVKIHSIYVMSNTRLAEMYEKGEFSPPSLTEYVDCAVHILTNIPQNVIVHRITGDCPKGLLVAPAWNANKHVVINSIVSKMQFEGLSQGCLHKE